MILDFWYRTAEKNTLPFDEAEKTANMKHGTIRVINLDHEPYEVCINANGYGFHAIFGSQENGHFLCIPDWNVGCELSSYKDRFWNIESIVRSGNLGSEEACAIGNALDLLDFLIKDR